MTVVRPVVQPTLRVSSGTVEGLLIQKTMPVYPAIARATGTSGTVTLGAIISRTGTIENLRVISGPMMLQQAALDAVRTWRYRPYLLNGQPVEVETTVSVTFTLQR
jgi:protein TonB